MLELTWFSDSGRDTIDGIFDVWVKKVRFIYSMSPVYPHWFRVWYLNVYHYWIGSWCMLCRAPLSPKIWCRPSTIIGRLAKFHLIWAPLESAFMPGKERASHIGPEMKPVSYIDTLWILISLKTQTGALVPHMRYVCELRADLSQLRRAVTKETGPNGTEFWKVVFKVAVMFGGTRLQARLLWQEGVRLS